MDVHVVLSLTIIISKLTGMIIAMIIARYNYCRVKINNDPARNVS